MAIVEIPQEKTWAEGMDLWVICQEDTPRWHRLDWLLNFQISNGLSHLSRNLPAVVLDILEETELPRLDFLPPQPLPLLISAQKLVPSRWVLVTEAWQSQQNESKLTAEIFKIWSDLGKPSMRVFAPDGLSSDNFQKLWQSASKGLETRTLENIEVVN